MVARMFPSFPYGKQSAFIFKMQIMLNMLHGREFWRKSEHASTYLILQKFCEQEQASTYLIFASNVFMVPENIHTPTTEGIGNSEGEGGYMIDLLSRGSLIQYGFECRSSCSKILSYLLNRSFTWKIVAWILVFDSTYIRNTFSLFKKDLGS